MARVLISMPEEFLTKIDEVAEGENRTRSELIREALRTYIHKQKVKENALAIKNANILEVAKKFINEKVPDINFALEQACFIVAEDISDNASFRKYIRNYLYKNGLLKSSMKKNAVDEAKTYEMYYNYEIKVSWVKPHQLLALNRGEKEGILKVDIDAPIEPIESFLERKFLMKHPPFNASAKTKHTVKEQMFSMALLYQSFFHDSIGMWCQKTRRSFSHLVII